MPAAPMAAPQPTWQPEPAEQKQKQFDDVKANLSKLTAKLSMLAKAQEVKNQIAEEPSPAVKQQDAEPKPDNASVETVPKAQESKDSPEYQAITQQLAEMASSLTSLQSDLSGLQTNTVRPSQVIGIKDAIDRNYRQIVSRLEGVSGTDIDPSAYARAVEASHADIIEQVKQIQSTVQSTAISPEHFAGAVEAGYSDIAMKIDQLSSAMASSGVPYQRGDLDQLKSQLSSLESAVSSIVASNADVGSQDLSGVEGRLEEINRAIVALSSIDNGTDSLDRIEARLKEHSRELEALATREPANVLNESLGTLENHFVETFSVLKEIEGKLNDSTIDKGSSNDELSTELKTLGEKIEDLAGRPISAVDTSATDEAIRELESRLTEAFKSNEPAVMELCEEIRKLGDKVENFAVAKLSKGDGTLDYTALLERLDTLADREIPKPSEIDFSRFDDHFDGVTSEFQKLGEKIDGISLPAQSSSAEIDFTSRFDEIVQRLDQITLGNDGKETDHSSELLLSLQEQIAGLSEQIGHVSTSGVATEPITQSLGSIEQQLGASRDISIELAAGAAEEAVRRVMQDMPVKDSGVDPQLIAALHEDVQKLHESVTPNTGSDIQLGELKDTLSAIAERLGSLEAGIHEIRTQGVKARPREQVVFGPPVYEGFGSEEASAETGAVQFAGAMPAHSSDPLMDGQLPAENHHEVDENGSLVPADADGYSAEAHELGEAYDETQEVKLSAGEQLVKAARMAEQERMRAKQEQEEDFVSSQPQPDVTEAPESLAAHAHSLAEEQRAALPEMPTPDLAPMQMPEAYRMSENYEPVQEDIEEDAPIEPGSSGPDLAALVKQANERRKTLENREDGSSGTDFLAAARKAAQAAALEASVVEAEAEAAKPQKSKNLLSSLPSLINKRKKVIAIAAAATLLVAIAVPIVSMFASNGPSGPVAEVAVNQTDETFVDSGVENIDLSQERVAAVSGLVEEQAENPYPQPLVEEVALDENAISDEQTSSTTVSPEPFPFDTAKINFASDALLTAVEENDPAAVFEIGRRYTNGIGTDKDLATAAIWYEHAAKLGHVPAQYLIGNFNEKGVGVEANRILAEAWYEQAAESGHVIAMHNLAVLNASPDPATGETNLDKSFKWFSKAAEHGVRDSQVNMGIFLAKGTGVPVDLIESYKWFAIAAKSGDADAAEKRDFIADAMRPDQLEEARKRVENWKQTEPDTTANSVNIPDSWKSAEDKLAILSDQNTIAQAQSLLSKLGFDTGPADGVMGQKTRDAIVAFRTKSGLAVSDRLDVEFMEALKAVSI
ncbi:MAG: peptidoglycan-binding protein [Pseudomonadota bacterium]